MALTAAKAEAATEVAAMEVAEAVVEAEVAGDHTAWDPAWVFATAAEEEHEPREALGWFTPLKPLAQF